MLLLLVLVLLLLLRISARLTSVCCLLLVCLPACQPGTSAREQEAVNVLWRPHCVEEINTHQANDKRASKQANCDARWCLKFNAITAAIAAAAATTAAAAVPTTITATDAITIQLGR